MYHIDCGVENYADDTSIIVSGSTVEEINEKLEANCNSVSRWMKSNKLKLNAEKSHVITVGTNDRLKNLVNTVQVVIDGSTVYEAPCKQELFLGCYLSSDLKWQKQIENLNPITVRGGSSGPECQKTAYREKLIKTKILDFWLTFNV